MAEVCRFYGIIIRFYYREHPPTYFHAIYGEHEALVEIETGEIYRGGLPRTAYDLATAWQAERISRRYCKKSREERFHLGFLADGDAHVVRQSREQSAN